MDFIVPIIVFQTRLGRGSCIHKIMFLLSFSHISIRNHPLIQLINTSHNVLLRATVMRKISSSATNGDQHYRSVPLMRKWMVIRLFLFTQ